MQTILLAAVTQDGFIGKTTDDRSFNWTSEADKKFYVAQIKSVDAIIMGAKTFQTFHRYPKGSWWIIYSSHPEDFVNPSPAVITAEATKESPQALLARLEKEGLQSVAICGGASIYRQFLEAGVVDTIYLTVEPVTFGEGIAFFHGLKNEGNSKFQIPYFNLVKEEKMGDEGTVLQVWRRKI